MRRRNNNTSNIAPRIYNLLLLLLLITILFVPGFSFAQSEKEMQVLQMYFMEGELVVSATRTLKPLSQVAENMSIVTSEEIEAMNAHTVTEVLSRVPGMYVSFFGEDFGSGGALSIQGSDANHILVLLDGVPWNNMSGGNAILGTIPVGIIKNIEIIKGPASSAWGSSLGGVVNIVTKDSVDSASPAGSVSASYGERNTQDYRSDVSGRLGKVGYYLYTGKQESGGLRDDRDYNNDSIYSKIEVPFSRDINVSITAGYSEPHQDYGDLPSSDLIARDNITRVFFATSTISANLTDHIKVEGSFFTHNHKFAQLTSELSTGDLFLDTVTDEDKIGGSGKIIWQDDMHNAVFGVDLSDGDASQRLEAGPTLQAWGSPAISESDSGINKWAVFFNDTITIGDLSLTPGIRYDKNNIDGDFTSPSIGVTYRIMENTILRAAIAKGFTSPPLSNIESGGLFLDPNPDLDPENVWSYQAGAETLIADVLHAKTSYFHHDLKDALVKELYAAGAPTFNDLFFNKGRIKRDGVEVELRNAPIYNVSARAGFAYVHKRLYFDEATSEDMYSYNLAVVYDAPELLRARLDGRYIWWDDAADNQEYNTFIWDLNISKDIYWDENITGEIFFTAHNLFNGAHYLVADRQNPRRWIEAGLRLSY